MRTLFRGAVSFGIEATLGSGLGHMILVVVREPLSCVAPDERLCRLAGDYLTIYEVACSISVTFYVANAAEVVCGARLPSVTTAYLSISSVAAAAAVANASFCLILSIMRRLSLGISGLLDPPGDWISNCCCCYSNCITC